MQTEPLLLQVHPELDEFGAVLSRNGVLPVPSYHLGEESLATPNGVSYELSLSNTGEGVLLSGRAFADVHGSCARCLKPVVEHVEGSVEGYYLFDAAAAVEGYEQDEFDAVAEDGTIDVSGPIMAALVYGTPFILLCSEDCAGLCPTCGADLNEGPCSCGSGDAADPDNPFAALKNLKFDE